MRAELTSLGVFLVLVLASGGRLRAHDGPDEAFWAEHHPSVNPDSNANHEDLACAPGSVFDGAACAPCAENTYRALGMHACQGCPEGTTSEAGASSCVEPGAAEDGQVTVAEEEVEEEKEVGEEVAEEPKPAPEKKAPAKKGKGKKKDEGKKKGGSEGTKGSPAPAKAKTAEETWAEHHPFVNPDSDANHDDLACTPGFFFDGDGCKPCAANTHRPLGAHECVPCPPGQVSDPGSAACSDGSVGLQQDAPSAGDGTAAAFWKTMHPSVNPDSNANHDDLACSPGSVFDGAQCSPCPANTYRGVGMHECVACEPGFVSLPGGISCFDPKEAEEEERAAAAANDGDAAGAEAVAEDEAAERDPEDAPPQPVNPDSAEAVDSEAVDSEEEADGESSSCAPGSVASPAGDECYLCPSGQFSSTPANPCRACPRGFYSGAGSTSCEPCPRGTYATNPGQSECTPCGRGFYNPYFGATNASACVACPEGAHCPAERTRTPIQCGRRERASGRGNTACVECPALFHATADRKGCRPVSAFYVIVGGIVAAVAGLSVFVYHRAVSRPTRRSWESAFSPEDLGEGEISDGFQRMQEHDPATRRQSGGGGGRYGTL